MPTYNYKCKACDERFDKLCRIDDRKISVEEPCPSCGKTEVQQMIGAPLIGYELGGSLKRAGEGWKEVLSKVKATHTINNIND